MRDKVIVFDKTDKSHEISVEGLRVWIDRERDYTTRLDRMVASIAGSIISHHGIDYFEKHSYKTQKDRICSIVDLSERLLNEVTDVTDVRELEYTSTEKQLIEALLDQKSKSVSDGGFFVKAVKKT